MFGGGRKKKKGERLDPGENGKERWRWLKEEEEEDGEITKGK